MSPLPPVTVPCPFSPSSLRRVVLGCSCGSSEPLSRLYFCRHCLDLRCGFCVAQEVDSHYCPNCLENMPSAEARLKKNRCANCFDCPSCGHTLSTRATSTQTPSKEDPEKKVAKKVFYLACAYCRWTSREIGMPDQTVASGGWPEREQEEAPRMAELQEHYRALAQREKLAKESKRYLGRKLSYLSLSHKYGLMARERAGLPPIGQKEEAGAGPSVQGDAASKMVPAQAKNIEDVEVLDEDALFSCDVDLCKSTTLEQRMLQLDHQPETVKELFPKHKHLMIKRSQRCRKCEHNLSKPEYNPSSIKFKIQLAAYYHVPEVVLFKVEPMRAGDKCHFIVKVVNPTQHATRLEFLPLKDYEALEEKKKAEEEQNKANNSASAAAPAAADGKKPVVATTSVGLLRNPTLVKAGDHHKIVPNAACIVPPPGTSVFLPQRDDAAEYDDSAPAELKGVVDDDTVVAWRKANRVGVYMTAAVDKDVKKGEEVVAGFALKFVYTNTISALEQREAQTADILVPVYVNLGKESSK